MKKLAATMAQVMEGKTPEPSMGELMNSFPKPSEIQRAILAEIRKACARKEWSGLTEILAILGELGRHLERRGCSKIPARCNPVWDDDGRGVRAVVARSLTRR